MGNAAHSFLVDQDLLKAVRRVLRRRGIRLQDVDDAVAVVQVKVLEAATRGPIPTELGPLLAFCKRIARDYAIDLHRKNKARAKRNVGLCEDPDDCVDETDGPATRETLDRRRLVGVLYDQVVLGELPGHAMAILHAEAAGIPHKTTASELGLTDRAVEHRLAVIRQRYRARVADLRTDEDPAASKR